MPEIWKDIDGYNGTFKISSFGNVYSNRRKRLLKTHDNNRGYLIIVLWMNGSCRAEKIHRLVAKAFIPNPENLAEINHKDRNRKNNNVENLEWSTRESNLKNRVFKSRTLLSDAAVQHIRQQVIKPTDYAILYGVSRSSICNIQKYRRRKGVYVEPFWKG